MRVLIDTTYAARAPYSGTAVYLESLLRELEALDGVEVEAASNDRRGTPAGGGVGSARNAAVDAWWAEVELPRLARRARADVIHHALPARAHGRTIPQVVTVYDLAFEVMPGMFDRRFASYAHLTYRQAAAAADHVIAISETTAADIRSRWRISDRRLTVAALGPGQPLPEVPARAPAHFLYVGDDEPRKDLATLLAAYAEYRAVPGDAAPVPLILAGQLEDPHAEGVSVEGCVDRTRLAELYAGAVALVQPARYEGFGLTVLEAMAAGTAVIGATNAALIEIGADSTLGYPPGDRAALTQRLALLAGDPTERERLIRAGRRRAADFSWAACARAHASAYALAMQSRWRRAN